MVNFGNKKLILLNSFKFKLLKGMIKLKENNKVSIPAFVEDYIKIFDTFEDVYSFIINATDFSYELEEWLGYTDSQKHGNKENELKLLSALINGYKIENKTNGGE